ncbi:hypothetical protein [Gimesia algae]|uniref:Uncharacterized protein n=1 Tax=Gimesia algae TaxID=2527971 RepID=A0A517VBS3_9PLAN|nr:hypothetical protein [Gimesia algae]QDT90463.1 hypothetical protein Pan161_21150 [Gimesia algae]
MTDPTIHSRKDQLYRLLPLLYQTLDSGHVPEEKRGPLRELLNVIGEQVNLLEDDLARWYDNWFIETCEDWVVPYLGDLVGYESAARALNTRDDPESALNRAVVFPRREVANTIALRQRKGSLALLEELSRSIVHWPARAVEYRQMVSGSASLKQLRTHRSSNVEVRNCRSLAELGTVFDEIPRTVDIRRINSHRTQGRHNLPAVGLFVYRRKIDSATFVPWWSYRQKKADRFWGFFDPLGIERSLHVLPVPEESPETIAQQINLPIVLNRGLLAGSNVSLDYNPDEKPDYHGIDERFYGPGRSLLIAASWNDTRLQVLSNKEIVVFDSSLSPNATDKTVTRDMLIYNRVMASAARLKQRYKDFNPCHKVWVDPECGVLAFYPERIPNEVVTCFHYGTSAYLGGGEYNRGVKDYQFNEKTSVAGGGVRLARELNENIEDNTCTVTEIADSAHYTREWACTVGKSASLTVRSANRERPTISDLNNNNADFQFSGSSNAHLELDGLLFASGSVVFTGEFESIRIRHCTFVPGKTTLEFRGSPTQVIIEDSILGELILPEPDMCDSPAVGITALKISDSILDVRDSRGSANFVKLSANRTTVMGDLQVHELGLIKNCIFADCFSVRNQTAGCMRFSYVSPASRTPPQFHCQPALAIERALSNSNEHDSNFLRTPDEIRKRVAPQFVSKVFGHPDYMRLTDDCAAKILQGADDEGELGVYHNEYFTQRAAHLRQRLQEFLPAGNDAEIIFET